jgi:hypothetical protein
MIFRSLFHEKDTIGIKERLDKMPLGWLYYTIG